MNSSAPSSSWLFFGLDHPQRNKRAVENISHKENPTDNPINSESIIPQDEEISLTS
ncbi:MAG TPA: hypothetical protein ACHBX0_13800 [Arsenophonus sp.]